jgi:hypothetical protein
MTVRQKYQNTYFSKRLCDVLFLENQHTEDDEYQAC